MAVLKHWRKTWECEQIKQIVGLGSGAKPPLHFPFPTTLSVLKLFHFHRFRQSQKATLCASVLHWAGDFPVNGLAGNMGRRRRRQREEEAEAEGFIGDDEIKKGPWKAEEDEVLISHVNKHGPRDWSSIRSKGLLHRTGKSCRLRWVNKLRPNLKKYAQNYCFRSCILRVRRFVRLKTSCQQDIFNGFPFVCVLLENGLLPKFWEKCYFSGI